MMRSKFSHRIVNIIFWTWKSDHYKYGKEHLAEKKPQVSDEVSR